MATMRQASGAARIALGFITTGALTMVWTGIWAYWLMTHGSPSELSYYWCSGFFLSGVTLFLIGIAVGWIGKAARRAETPIGEVTAAAVAPEQPKGAHQQAPAPAPAAVPMGVLPQQPMPVMPQQPVPVAAVAPQPHHGGHR